MEIAGVAYAVDGEDGPPDDPALVARDLRAIRDELHATHVLLYGADVARLAAAGTVALAGGLDVWIQPRLVDRPHGDGGTAARTRLVPRNPITTRSDPCPDSSR